MKLILLAILSCFLVQNVVSISVMSVDLGSEWLKIGIVSPGVPMDIVLNKESKRKTNVVVSFRNGERLFGDDAMNVGVRFPESTYKYFLDLLGKKMDNPAVKLFQKRFPYYELVADDNRGTVLFKHDSQTYYSPEELLGMILNKCKEFAEFNVQQPVKEAVITVPTYFNQAERRAVINAAELAGIKVLQLINSNTASALNYGIFRRKDFNETSRYFLLYDMGASSSVATVVSYKVVKTKEKGISETNPQVSVLGVGYDRTLGGLEMQLRLRDFLAESFNNMKKTKTNIFKNPRAMAKLFKEAGRVKNVLSANTDHYAQVENLLDDQDFRLQVTREEFENMCSDLFEKIKAPVDKALNDAGLTIDIIEQVILVGAGTRVPKVQEVLSAHVNRELGKSLNTDEAAALGAVYRAADLSSGFKVKKFLTKDAVIYPIVVDFEREIDENGQKSMKIIRRTLFPQGNPYPQKKILTFNKHLSDFDFYVSYGDFPVPEEQAQYIGAKNLTKVNLKGLDDAMAKNSEEGTEFKGVKAHFHMDDSGILSIGAIEAVYEKNGTVEEEDTLSKIGSAFSKLFSGSTGDGDKPQDSANDTAAPKGSEGSKSEDGAESDGKKEKPAQEAKKLDVNKTEADAEPKDKKIKTVAIKEPIKSEERILDILKLEGENFQASSAKLVELNNLDKKRKLTEKARNSLESFVIELQDNLYTDEYGKAAAEEEKESLLKDCAHISDWLYEDGSDAEKETYEEKLKELKSKTRTLRDRVREHKERPDALEALEKMLNISVGFLEKSKELPEEEQYFTEVELSSLEKVISETLAWKMSKLSEQESLPLYKDPVLTVRSIADKIDSLDREVKYLINKAKVNKMKKIREENEAKAKEEKKKEDAADNKDQEKEVRGEKIEKDSPSVNDEDIVKNEADGSTEEKDPTMPEPQDKIEPEQPHDTGSSHTEL